MKENEFENLMNNLFGSGASIPKNSMPSRINIGDKSCTVRVNTVSSTIDEKIKEYDNNRIFSDDVLTELLADNLKDLRKKLTKEIEEDLAEEKRKNIDHFVAKIDKVYFGKGTTVIKWKDGTSTKVKCQEGEEFDKEKGIAMCIIKHIFGDIGYYNKIFKSLNLDENITETKPEVKKSKPKKTFFTFGDIFGL